MNLYRDQYTSYLNDTILLLKLTNNSHAQFQMVCFPYAGSGGNVFQPLAKYLPALIEVWSVEAPGHVHTKGDALENIDLLCEQYLSNLPKELFDDKVILFGHSLGAYVACAIASKLVSRGLQPSLILSGAQPPHLREHHIKLSSLPIDILTTTLISLNGLPQSWENSPELLELYEETLRADFKMYENFLFPRNIAHLPCLSINGYQDNLCSPHYAFEWTRYFKKIYVEFLTGKHLFLNENPGQIANIVVNFLNVDLI